MTRRQNGRKVRVLVLSHMSASGRLGGAERSLLALLPKLRALGMEAMVVAPTGAPVLVHAQEEGFATAAIDIKSSVYWAHPSNNLVGVVTNPVRQLVRRTRTIAVNSRKIPLLVGLARQWKAELVYTNSLTIAAGIRAAHRAGVPHVWHLREVTDDERCSQVDVGWRAYRTLLQSSESCIAISEGVKQNLFPDGGGNVHVIHNGIITETELSIGERRLAEPVGVVRTFGIIGGISKAKGQHEALQALAMANQAVPGLRLRIVGSGDAAPLKTLAQELGVSSQIDFVGSVPEPWPELARMDALLMCSRNEPFGRVTVEAMAAGVPVIGFDGGGTREIVNDGVNGLLYRHGAEELSKVMLQLVRDENRARQLAVGGHAAARDRFTVETCAARVFSVFSQTLEAFGCKKPSSNGGVS